MNYEQLAFVNQQLAGMLKAGIPLEGALGELSRSMERNALRQELESLGSDLKQGVPLIQAVDKRALPDLYRQILRVGAASRDLPRVLILLADYYQRLNTTWTRLKGLMVYPAIVLSASLVLCGVLLWVLSAFITATGLLDPNFWSQGTRTLSFTQAAMWTPFLLLAVLTLTILIGLSVPAWRNYWRWRLPGFREASLARLAASLSILLHSGVHLRDALKLMSGLEQGTIVGRELDRWSSRLAEGQGRLREISAESTAFPQLFLWAMQSDDEPAEAFRRAADLYHARAGAQIEMVLYAALPMAVLALGLMIIAQVIPAVRLLLVMLNSLGTE